jgi:two-component system, LytTR family, sensor kinase
MGEILNLIGLSAGVALYAMLLVMVLRGGRTPAARVDPLLLSTAFLGLVWNLCALPAYELPKLGFNGPFPLLTLFGFSALGFLPAVVVHSVLRGQAAGARRRWIRLIVSVAYAVSTTAALLHLRAAASGDPIPSSIGMRLLTYCFVGLVVPLAVVTRGQPGARRMLWAAALSIFAVSALHLSQFHEGDASWPVELVGHHASVPLALAILYQDFPFALADLFLKRALTLLASVAAPFTVVAALRVAPVAGAGTPREVRDVSILAAVWVATALLYPKIRDAAEWFVDTIVLDRPDYDALRGDIARRIQQHDDEQPVLDDACARLAPALSARVVRWKIDGRLRTVALPAIDGDTGPLARDGRLDRSSIAAIVDVPVVEPPRYAIEVAELTGGRRLLSDDHAALTAIAALLGHRIDAIRLTHERYERQLREQEIGKLATEAELRALRAQINPHFLFNALTTIGYLIQTSPARALETLLRLTALLRAVLRSENEFTTLGREIELVEAYLDIERARFEDRLRVSIDVPATLRNVRVPPLLLQPIVENAVKHGITPERHGGDVIVSGRMERGDGGSGLVLILCVRDSGAGASAEHLKRGRDRGLGLSNVERRLACHYGDAATLSIASAPGAGTVVEIHMPAEFRGAAELMASRSAT